MIIFAHQGGWDEFLYFTIPVVLGFAWLRCAEKRARSKAEQDKGEPGDSG